MTVGTPAGRLSSPVPGAITHLRAMTPQDLDAVMAIEVGAYPWPWSRGNFADTLAAGHWAQVLVEADGQLAGYIVAMHGATELHLLNVTVATARQGHGLGRALLAALDRHAFEHGLQAIWLEVRASNERARALYAGQGFAEVGLRRQYYPGPPGRREDAVLMSRAVVPAGSATPSAVDAAAYARCDVPAAASRPGEGRRGC